MKGIGGRLLSGLRLRLRRERGRVEGGWWWMVDGGWWVVDVSGCLRR